MGVISIVNGDYKPTYNYGGTTLYVYLFISLDHRVVPILGRFDAADIAKKERPFWAKTSWPADACRAAAGRLGFLKSSHLSS